MKYVLLSTDGPVSLYEVPDKIAKDLTKHCVEFLNWVHYGPEAKRFKKGYIPEKEFIDYLNSVVNPNYIYRSRFIKTLATTEEDKLRILEEAEPYKDYPHFNF